VLSYFKDDKIVPSWPDFIEDAIKCDWNIGALRTKISSSTGDVYGPHYRDEVLKRFDLYINKRA